jgi:Kef-type K+ transport system membrane component KefB
MYLLISPAGKLLHAPMAAAASEGMSPVLQFLLVLALVIFAAKAAGYLSARLGQPAVLGELLAGVILGPSLINLYNLGFIQPENRPYLENTIKIIAELGVIFLMFMAGLETNLSEMFKVGKVAVFSGISGVIFPIAFGILVAMPFGYTFEKSLFIGIILAATSVSISAQTMLELGVLRKREGVALLGAAVFDDVLVVLVLSFYLAMVGGGSGGGALEIIVVILKMAAFFLVTALLGLKVLPWALSRVKKLPISENITATMVVLVLLTAWAAEYLGGVALIVGAFMVGVLAARTRFRHELEEKFRTIIYALLVPVFFVSIGLLVNLGSINGEAWFFAGLVCVAAIVSKIIGCGLGARLTGFNNLSSLRLGVGMVSRGEVGLIVASVGISEGILNQQVYAATVLMVLVTTLFTPFALKLAFRGEKKADAGIKSAEQVEVSGAN